VWTPGDTVTSHGNLALRYLRDEEADYRLLSRWLTDERLLEWIYGRDNPWPYDRVVTKYRPRVLAEDPVRPCFIVLDSEFVGYIQFHPVADAASYGLEDAVGHWGVDMWIGEPDLWSGGLGTRALRMLLGHIFEAEGATVAVIAPRVENPRAVRCYEKAGFRCVKVLSAHELHEGAWRDSWLMVATPGDLPGFRAP
jgi:aminoglycoside 6'-N-acetyltransferase